jgi:hypothetical protein
MLEKEDIKLIKNIVSEIVLAKIPTNTQIKKPRKKAVKKVVKKSVKAPKTSKKITTQKKSPNIISPQPIRLNGKREGINNRVNRASELEGRGHNYGRTEAFQFVKNRPNLFLSSDVRNMHKEDVKIDKILNKNKQTIQRREAVQMYSVDCIRCGKEFVVTYDIIPFDAETNEPNYICDSCVRR